MQVERMLPLYEGKMGIQYDHRFASFFGIGDTDIRLSEERGDLDRVLPRYWVREEVVGDRLKRRQWACRSALLAHRRVARNTDERTAIATLIPFGAASYGWILTAGPDVRGLALLIAQYNSFVFDYVLRQFLSQPSVPQVTYEQLPILTSSQITALDPIFTDTHRWIVDRVVHLVGSGVEMSGFVRDLGRDDLLPIEWDGPRREILRVELDAAMFLLLEIGRPDVEYIMASFPIVKRKDEAAFGTFRTKDLILQVYDAMRTAIDSGETYASPFDRESSVASTTESRETC